MVDCPIFLKKNLKDKQAKGITLIEVLIVFTFLAAMVILLVSSLNPAALLAKGRDSRRKADLQKLKNPLEDYYNDHECYPSSLDQLKPYYLDQIPTDPLTRQPYSYSSVGCDKYYLYTLLENVSDQEIAQVGCQSGCGPENRYNYGVASANTRLEVSSPTPTPPPPGQLYGCFSGVCKPLVGPVCDPNYINYPNCDPGGIFQCGTPENPKNECR